MKKGEKHNFKPTPLPDSSFLSMIQSWFIPILVVLAIAFRLPYIHSPFMILHGDESLLAVVARHILQGEIIPAYPYGSHYGISIFETLIGALAFSIGGVNGISFKYSMLFIFICGLIFFYLASKRLLGKWGAFWITLLLIFMPPWTLWSLQARGGYLPAFAFTPIACYIAFGSWESRRMLKLALLAGVTIIIFHSQTLWVAGLLPILFWPLLRDRRWKLSVLLLVSLTVGIIATRFLLIEYTVRLPQGGDSYWNPQVINFKAFPASLLLFPKRVYQHLSTGLFFGGPKNIPFSIAGAIWCALLIGAGGIQVWRLLKRRWLPWSHVLFLSVGLTLGYSLFICYWPRYILPLSGYLFLWVGVEAADFAKGRRDLAKKFAILAMLLAVFGGAGVLSANKYLYSARHRPAKSAEQCIIEFIARLDQNGIRHVYALNGLLSWQLNFYGQEKVIARWKDPADRYEEYPRRIDQALYGDESTAYVGYRGNFLGLERYRPKKLHVFRDLPYFFYLNPEPKTLKTLKFKLNPIEDDASCKTPAAIN